MAKKQQKLIQTLIGPVMDQPLIYLAGPYTRPDPVANTRQVIKVAEALLRLPVLPVVPHLSLLWHLVRPRPYRFWLEYDLQLVARADAVLRIPGPSDGADTEVTHARQWHIPVLHPHSRRAKDCVEVVRNWLLDRHQSGGPDDQPAQ
jgi:hypothetical protein